MPVMHFEDFDVPVGPKPCRCLLNQVAQASNTAAAGGAPLPDPSTAASPAAATAVAAAVPGDWGTILKSKPALPSVAVADAVAQGIVNTINVYA